jgi:type IV pilus assembly protein PilP
MKCTHRSVVILSLCLAASLSLLSGCSGANGELSAFIAQTKQEPGGRVEPLPEVKPYESFIYAVATMRSPFLPGSPGGTAGASGLRPDTKRNREFLEQFPLDTLRMVGTLKLASQNYGLVQTKDGLVHRVVPGNFLGTSDGKVIDISPSKIQVIEIVPDGLGGYMERAAALALNE